MSGEALRRAVIATSLAMSRSGLSPGKSGNVSVRTKEGMLITPSGVPYEDLKPGDIVRVLLDGTAPAGQLVPSSEWHFHLGVYLARADAQAIVHTHSPYATALACLREGIPAFHYMVAVAGQDHIPCAPYATFGTPALAAHIIQALGEEGLATLMANHGQIALGATLAKALALAHEVETLAAQYMRARAIGTPTLLSRAEMKRVLTKFKTYGAQPTRKGS